VRVDEHTVQLPKVPGAEPLAPVFYRSAPCAGTPPLYVHGAPLSSEELLTLLERTGGIAPDLIGFGRSAKGGHLDYTLEGQAAFLERLLEHLRVERVRLFAHGLCAGGALLFAQGNPERIERLAICDALPLRAGFEWPPLGRWLRRPLAGELMMGATGRWLLARTLRGAGADPGAFDRAAIENVWRRFDQGTQRAILRIVRDASPERLAEAGEGLGALRGPALVLWGERDPWFDARWATAYGERLAHARVEIVPGAGHFPWRTDPGAADTIASFLGDGAERPPVSLTA
jgi:pimeloyl-ACP methyl ester carboxylesterase